MTLSTTVKPELINLWQYFTLYEVAWLELVCPQGIGEEIHWPASLHATLSYKRDQNFSILWMAANDCSCKEFGKTCQVNVSHTSLSPSNSLPPPPATSSHTSDITYQLVPLPLPTHPSHEILTCAKGKGHYKRDHNELNKIGVLWELIKLLFLNEPIK